MTCERTPEIIGIGTVESVDTKPEPEDTGSAIATNSYDPTPSRPSIINHVSTTVVATTTSTTISTTTTPAAAAASSTTEFQRAETSSSNTPRTVVTNRPTVARTGNVVIMRTTLSPPKQIQDQLQQQQQQHQPRPPLVLGSPLYKSKFHDKDTTIVVKDVLRQDNAVIIYWDTEATDILGFKVIYRLFGDNSFKQAPPLEASEREFKIKNVPSQVRLFTYIFIFRL